MNILRENIVKKSALPHIAIGLCLVLSACGGQEPVTDDTGSDMGGTAGDVVETDAGSDDAAVPDKMILPDENVVDGPDDLKLKTLTLKDFQKIIGPLKGCNFKMPSDSDAIFVANAPTDPKAKPAATVRFGDAPLQLTATQAGGMSYLAAGPEFEGSDIGVSITPVEGEGKSENMKSRMWQASMVVRGEEGRVRVYRDGEYSCDL